MGHSTPGAYETIAVLHRTHRASVRRARRTADGQPVILKSPLPGPAATTEIQRYRAIFDRLATLSLPGVCLPVALEQDEAGLPLLVFIDGGGRSLDRLLAEGPLPLGETLRVGIEVAEGLDRLHHVGLVHRDVKPANIVVEAGGAQLIDLESAAPPEQTQVGRRRDHLGTSAFAAPEQSGLLARSVDERADLFALGATLYEALTGQRPFADPADEPGLLLQLVRTPARPSALVPEIPEIVSDIVLRLLARLPEDRYQTGSGVAYDLRRCADALDAGTAAPSFPLGEHDLSRRLRISRRIAGRDAEMRHLRSAVSDARAGQGQLLVLCGPAGIGKTALALELGPMAAAAGARFGAGRYDAGAGRPYQAIVRALSRVLQGLLGQPEPAIERVRADVGAALGEGAGVLSEVLPALATLLGPIPPAPDLPLEQARNRFERLVCRLVEALGGPVSPLVLLLDDLQWADASSFRLLDRVLVCDGARHLVLVCTCRPVAMAAGRPLVSLVARPRPDGVSTHVLELQPIGADAISALLADTLGSAPPYLISLSDELRVRTGGNPLFVGRFLRAMVDVGALRPDEQGTAWLWDRDRTEAMGVTDNVATMMAAELADHPEATRRLLAIGATAGRSFDLGIVAKLEGLELREVKRRLQPALVQAHLKLLGPPLRSSSRVTDSDDESPAACFPHDRVREAALDLADGDSWATTHLRLARHLLESADGEPTGFELFEVLDHLSPARDALEDADERREAARLFLAGASLARSKGAARETLDWLVAGHDLLREEDWEDHRPLAFELHLGLLEAAMLALADPSEVDARVDDLQAHVRGFEERAALLELRIRLFTVRNDYLGAIEAALAELTRMTVEVPATAEDFAAATGAEVGRLLATGKGPPDLLAAPEVEDPEVRAEIRVLAALSTPAYLRPHILGWAVARAVRLLAEHGNTPEAAWCYVAFGMGASMQGNHAQGAAFAELGLELNERRGERKTRGTVEHLHSCFVAPWTRPLREAWAGCRSAASLALEHGGHHTAGYALFNLPWLDFEAGSRLQAVITRTETDLRVARDLLAYDDGTGLLSFALHPLHRLSGDAGAAGRLEAMDYGPETLRRTLGDRFDAFSVDGCLFMAAEAMLDPPGQALRWVDALAPQITTAVGHIGSVMYPFWRGVARTDAWASADAQSRAAWRSDLEADVAHFAALEQTGPSNWQARRLLLEARVADVDGAADAGERYELAARVCADGGFVHLQALALDRAADWWERRDGARLARSCRAAARTAWASWGAWARVRAIDKAWPDLEAPAPPSASSISETDEGPDPRGDGVLGRLLARLVTTLIAAAHAERGWLIVRRPDGWRIEAAAEVGGPPSLLSDRPLEEVDEVHAPLVEFVARSGRPLVVEDASAHPLLSGVPGVERSSVLCAPVAAGDGTVTVVYLHNSLAPGLFTPERTRLIEVLASVASTSINAVRAYEGLQDQSDDLRVALSRQDGEMQQLLRSQQDILGSLSEGVLVLDDDGVIAFANPAAGRLAGAPPSDLVGVEWRKALDVVGGTELFTEGQRVAGAAPGELRLRRGDGSEVVVEWTVRRKHASGHAEEGWVATLREVTEERRLAEQLRQAQRLQALGQISGGVAHDLNNLLTPILGMIDLIVDTLPKEDSRRGLLDAAEASAVQAAALVRQLLAFGRQVVPRREPLDVERVLGEARTFIDNAVETPDVLEWQVGPHDFWIDAEATQLQQVVMNLVLNARDAVRARGRDHHGRIVVASRDRHFGAGSEPPARAGRVGEISVSDNGVGIEGEAARRLFEPFFTTKEFGEGVGLGLAVVHGTVHAHGGWVDWDSEPGRGTRFRCYFPARAPATTQEMPVVDEGPPDEGGRVLLIDDDDAVRALARSVLEHAGLQIEEASDGIEGLQRYQADGPFDAVLLDLAMPRMRGDAVLAELLALDPDARVVLWSGYSVGGPAANARALGAAGFVAKPARAADLVSAITAAMRSRPAPGPYDQKS